MVSAQDESDSRLLRRGKKTSSIHISDLISLHILHVDFSFFFFLLSLNIVLKKCNAIRRVGFQCKELRYIF